MSRGRIHRLHEVAQAAGQRIAASQPWLRMVGLTYAGVGALAAVGLVATASFTPVGRVVQRVAVPAQEAVTNATQSARGALGGVFTGPVPRFIIPPRAPALAVPEPDNALEAAEPEASEAIGADAEAHASQAHASQAQDNDAQTGEARNEPQVRDSGQSAVAFVDSPADGDEASLGAPIEAEEAAEDAEPAAAEEPVLVVVEPPVMQAASQSTPQPLPTLTPPPVTVAQVKARMDAANQAAIDAEKAARARTKADAEAANEAAISGQRAPATPTATPVPTATPTSAPAPAPTSSVTSAQGTPAPGSAPSYVPTSSPVTPIVQSTPTGQPAQKSDRALSAASTDNRARPASTAVGGNAANDAAISAARTATAEAKARADAANQAAIAAARTAHVSPTPTPRPVVTPPPTPLPTASIPPTPSPQAEEAPATLEEQLATNESDDEDSPEADLAPDTEADPDPGA